MSVTLLSVVLLFTSPKAVDTYGKTEADILRMGQDVWCKYYTSKAGESTAATTSAYGIYGDIAAKRNDRLLAAPYLPKREAVRRLRKLLTGFGGDIAAVGEAISGGGTIWNTIAAQQYADKEETIYAVIHPQGLPRPKPVVVSMVTKELAKIPAMLHEALGEGMLTTDVGFTATKGLEDAKSVYRQIVKIAATYDRPTCDRILGYCLTQAEFSNTMSSGK